MGTTKLEIVLLFSLLKCSDTFSRRAGAYLDIGYIHIVHHLPLTVAEFNHFLPWCSDHGSAVTWPQVTIVCSIRMFLMRNSYIRSRLIRMEHIRFNSNLALP